MTATNESIDLRLAVTDAPPAEGNPVKLRCREHPDQTASLAVYPDHLHCFGCGFHLSLGDPALPGYTDPLAYLLGEEPTDRSAYAATAPLPERKVVEREELEPLPRCLATIYHEVLCGPLRRHRLDWLYERGLNDETIARAELGHDGKRFVIPVGRGGDELITLRYRLDPYYCSETEVKKHKYLGLAGRNGRYLYPMNAVLNDGRDYLVLCEGEFDALRLWQEGIPALTITNGAGQVDRLPKLVAEHFPRVRHLYIATDQDTAGNEAMRKTASEASKLGFWVTRLGWPVDAKDVTDAFLKGYSDVFYRLDGRDDLAPAA